MNTLARGTHWQSQFLGEELSRSENDAASARFHVIPCGLEKTVSYGTGTARGPEAIIAASHQLERLLEGEEPCQKGIFTTLPIDCSGPVEACLSALRAAVAASASDGHIPIVLGGEHSLSWGAVMGLRDVHKRPFGIVQIDAHADLREAYQGQPHSHASVMNLLVREQIPLFQLGVRAFCAEEAGRRAAYNVGFVDAGQLMRGPVHDFTLPDDFPADIYISFDLDGLDPSVIAATGTPVPGGLGFYQVLDLLSCAAAGRRVIGADVVELAPHPAHSHCDFTAALLCYHLMRLAGSNAE